LRRKERNAPFFMYSSLTAANIIYPNCVKTAGNISTNF
jgi:hypothetical protein